MVRIGVRVISSDIFQSSGIVCDAVKRPMCLDCMTAAMRLCGSDSDDYNRPANIYMNSNKTEEIIYPYAYISLYPL